MIGSKGGITLDRALQMTVAELTEWNVRLGESAGGTFDYQLMRWVDDAPGV